VVARKAASGGPASAVRHQAEPGLQGILQLIRQFLDAGIPGAGGTDRELADRSGQRLAFFAGSRHLRAGQPQHHLAEVDQDLVDVPVDLDDEIIHHRHSRRLQDQSPALQAVPAAGRLWLTVGKVVFRLTMTRKSTPSGRNRGIVLKPKENPDPTQVDQMLEPLNDHDPRAQPA